MVKAIGVELDARGHDAAVIIVHVAGDTADNAAVSVVGHRRNDEARQGRLEVGGGREALDKHFLTGNVVPEKETATDGVLELGRDVFRDHEIDRQVALFHDGLASGTKGDVWTVRTSAGKQSN